MSGETRRDRRIASGMALAHTLVARAIRHGELAPLVGQKCADCGEPAIHYDHRDYGRPLDVVPTCRRCNYARGPAKWASEHSDAPVSSESACGVPARTA